MNGIVAQSTSQHVAAAIGIGLGIVAILALWVIFLGKIFITIKEDWRPFLITFLVVTAVATFIAAMLLPEFTTALLVGVGFGGGAVILFASFS